MLGEAGLWALSRRDDERPTVVRSSEAVKRSGLWWLLPSRTRGGRNPVGASGARF